MKKINLRGISEILSEKELKNVLGGSDCAATCGVSITDCNGTCSAGSNCATCTGQTQTLTKCCN